MKAILGVLLDIDGTLVDSNDPHAHAWKDAFQAFDIPISYPVMRSLVGMGGDKIIPRVAGFREDSERGEKLARLRGETFKTKYLPMVRPFDGTRELIQAFKKRGWKVVVASSASREDLDSLLGVANIQDLISETTSSDDAEESKPDPDIIRAALQKIDLPADSVVMVGDTPYDIEAAALAGVRTIALCCGGWDKTYLTGAWKVFESPADLLKHFQNGEI